jgi:hypothetical protein
MHIIGAEVRTRFYNKLFHGITERDFKYLCIYPTGHFS